jgi:CPA1 family monovalent cation:H+ antiporter
MTWSGLRGAVSVVLVLGIVGLALPNTEKMFALTYGLVLGSNVFQGLTMTTLVNKLRLYSTRSRPEPQPQEEQSLPEL